MPHRLLVIGDSADRATFVGASLLVRVGLVDSANTGVTGFPVEFAVLSGGGTFTSVRAVTDSFGYAEVTWRLGTDPTLVQSMIARAAFLAPLTITASTSMPELAFRIRDVFPAPQLAGHTLDDSLDVQVLLPDGRPLVNARVIWNATLWGARHRPSDPGFHLPGVILPHVSRTDSSGRSQAQFTLGTAERGALGVTMRVIDDSYDVIEDFGTEYGLALLWPTWRTAGPVWRSLTAGSRHTCGIAVDGKTYCFGQSQGFFSSDGGQVGNGGRSNYPFPELVLGGLMFAQLSGGHVHTCGVSISQELYCWGDNEMGALGTGDTVSTTAPVRVTIGAPIASVIGGVRFTCALSDAGQALCWGLNRWAALGDGTTTDRYTPTPVATSLRFVQIVAQNDMGVCALTDEGEAWCWGANLYGQVGDGTTQPRLAPTAVAGGIRFAELQGGTDHACGRTSDGSIYCWGRNQWGQLGDGTTITRPVPTRVATSERFEKLATGMANEGTRAITVSGDSMCWGANWLNYIGVGPSETQTAPETCAFGGITLGCSTRPIFTYGRRHRYVSLTQGAEHNCGVTDLGDGYCWGDDTFGQTGSGVRQSGGAVPGLVARPGTRDEFAIVGQPSSSLRRSWCGLRRQWCPP